ncbi:MAG: twin-arginine translocase TatA/TatE family subunit [Planctomycetota bacterium]
MVLALLETLGGLELLIVCIAGLLVFGRRLPEVAGQAGKQLVKVRRSIDAAWRETGMEKELREVKRDIDAAIPRDLSIADMARLASAEMDRRVKANEKSASVPAAPEAEASKPAASAPPASGSETGPTATRIDV